MVSAETTTLIGIGSAIVGAAGGIAVMKEKISTLEKWKKDLQKEVVYKDVCVTCKEDWTNRLKSVEAHLTELKNSMDVKLNMIIQFMGIEQKNHK